MSSGYAISPLQRTGSRGVGSIGSLLRDRGQLVPADVPWHITPLEADHVYLE